MGKLQLGSTVELSQRIKAIEDTEVVKTLDTSNNDSDVQIVAEE